MPSISNITANTTKNIANIIVVSVFLPPLGSFFIRGSTTLDRVKKSKRQIPPNTRKIMNFNIAGSPFKKYFFYIIIIIQ